MKLCVFKYAYREAGSLRFFKKRHYDYITKSVDNSYNDCEWSPSQFQENYTALKEVKR